MIAYIAALIVAAAAPHPGNAAHQKDPAVRILAALRRAAWENRIAHCFPEPSPERVSPSKAQIEACVQNERLDRWIEGLSGAKKAAAIKARHNAEARARGAYTSDDWHAEFARQQEYWATHSPTPDPKGFSAVWTPNDSEDSGAIY